LNLQFKNYEVSKISALLWADCQCSKFCPKLLETAQNLPKSAKSQNFEIPSKIKILVFFKTKILCIEHVSTVWIFNPRIFHMLFLLSKNSLCM
jgi:hypothetical protein